jgi:hypothetical protein
MLERSIRHAWKSDLFTGSRATLAAAYLWVCIFYEQLAAKGRAIPIETAVLEPAGVGQKYAHYSLTSA